MIPKRYQLIGLFSLTFLFACRLKPVDNVYIGYWENTQTEIYDYATAATKTISVQDLLILDKLPSVIHLAPLSQYYHYDRDQDNNATKTTYGKWSIRNTNDLTIQKDQSLFHGKIVLLNDVLRITGIEYPLDSNQKVIQADGFKITTLYRKMAESDYRQIKGVTSE